MQLVLFLNADFERCFLTNASIPRKRKCAYMEKMRRTAVKSCKKNLWCNACCLTNAANSSRSMRNPRTSLKKSKKNHDWFLPLRNFPSLRRLGRRTFLDTSYWSHGSTLLVNHCEGCRAKKLQSLQTSALLFAAQPSCAISECGTEHLTRSSCTILGDNRKLVNP